MIQASSGSADQKHKGKNEERPTDKTKETSGKQKPDRTTRQAAATTTAENAADSASSDDERQFHRRQLVSNWSRYDDLPSEDDDDIPLQRGEDFNKLLAQAGGSAAHFRFKDEEMWSEDLDGADTTVNVLSLNLHDVASSLNCIPLHERLTVSEKVFTEKQLNEMTSRANDALQIYNQNIDETSSVVVQTKLTLDKHKLPNSAKPNADSPQQSAQPVNVNETPTCVQTKVTDSFTEDAVSAEVKSLEDDLDMLLSNDGPAVKPSVSPAVKQSQVSSSSASHNIKPSLPVSSPGKSIVKQKVIGKEENLEDWLDSVLDD